jgi:uncharacterized protein (TIGR02145 family)
MTRLVHSIFACALVAMLCACGGDSSTSTVKVVDSDGIPTIAAGEKLLKADCNKSTIGSFVYVEDSLLIFHCTEWGWRAYTGRDGKEGKAGANGKDGEDGQNGNDGMDGDSCSIDSYANGFAVVCGSSSARLLYETMMPDTCDISSVSQSGFNVTCGEKSERQKAGAAGRAGRGCSMRDLHNGAYEFMCPEDTVKVYAANCGGKPYDPKQGYCVFDTVRTPEEYKKYSKCWEQAVDWSNHFCDTRDGHAYLYEKIGDQVWMAENLAYGDSVQTPSLIYGHDCSDTNNGCAYKWGAAMDSIALARDTVYKAKCGYRENNSLTCQLPPIVRGICPEGWHLPRRHEFTTMTNILSETELRSLLSNRVGQTDIPRYFWTPEIDVEEAWTMCLTGISYPPGFRTRPMNKKWYVRCVKDN